MKKEIRQKKIVQTVERKKEAELNEEEMTPQVKDQTMDFSINMNTVPIP